jgi:hypothetical protein
MEFTEFKKCGLKLHQKEFFSLQKIYKKYATPKSSSDSVGDFLVSNTPRQLALRAANPKNHIRTSRILKQALKSTNKKNVNYHLELGFQQIVYEARRR